MATLSKFSRTILEHLECGEWLPMEALYIGDLVPADIDVTEPKLVDRGFVETHPNQKLFRITDAGRLALAP